MSLYTVNNSNILTNEEKDNKDIFIIFLNILWIIYAKNVQCVKN